MNWSFNRMDQRQSNAYNRPYAYGNRYGSQKNWGESRSNYFRQNGGRRSRVQLKTSEKHGCTYLTGWKVGKSGFRSFLVWPAKSPKHITSKSGKQYVTCSVTVVNKSTSTKSQSPAFWNVQTNKVICKELGLILDPNTGFISYIPRKK